MSGRKCPRIAPAGVSVELNTSPRKGNPWNSDVNAAIYRFWIAHFLVGDPMFLSAPHLALLVLMTTGGSALVTSVLGVHGPW